MNPPEDDGSGSGTDSGSGAREPGEGEGAGAAPERGQVLPFRPTDSGAGSKSKRGRPLGKDHGGLWEEMQVAEETGLEDRIGDLATRGLNEQEIRALLTDRLRAEPISRRRFAAALEAGRIMGLARIKSAQFEAALKGGVTAQALVLARLRGEEEGIEGGEREIKVQRKIITAPEKKT